jgi:hypothetical protein
MNKKLCTNLTCFGLKYFSEALTFQPEFAEPIVNISVAIGRDATFTCHVRHLGGYRVKSDFSSLIEFILFFIKFNSINHWQNFVLNQQSYFLHEKFLFKVLKLI